MSHGREEDDEHKKGATQEGDGGDSLSAALFFIYLFIYLFIYFWLGWIFVAARGLSLVVASGGYSLLRCAGFYSLQWLLLLRSTGSRRAGFSSCGSWAQ